MSSPSRSPLAGIRDVLVGTTVEGEFDPPIAAIGYGLTLAKAAKRFAALAKVEERHANHYRATLARVTA